MVKQTARLGYARKSILDGIIFWLPRQEKAVVLGSCKPAIYIDL
jgi:hypothetical protein